MHKDAISECVKAAQVLYDLKLSKFKPVPSGWFTWTQFMEANDIRITAAKEKLNALVKSGKLRSQMWSIPNINGRPYKAIIYKLK